MSWLPIVSSRPEPAKLLPGTIWQRWPVCFYDHFDEMVAEMRSVAEQIETQMDQQCLSREELLQRGQGTP
jgi:hypothetical protein